MAHAAERTTKFTASDALHLIITPLRATWDFLIMLAENGHRMQEVEKLNKLSDEDLAAKGLTRTGELNRIFGSRLYM